MTSLLKSIYYELGAINFYLKEMTVSVIGASISQLLASPTHQKFCLFFVYYWILPWMIIRLFLNVISMYKTAIKSMVLEKCLNRRDYSFNIAILVRWEIYNFTSPYVFSAIFAKPSFNRSILFEMSSFCTVLTYNKFQLLVPSIALPISNSLVCLVLVV